jgi:hypothetical protein
VQHEDGPAGRDTNHERHSNRAHLCPGWLFLQGWRDGPSAYLSPSDALSLRRELAAAFGSSESALRRDQGDAL